MSPFSLARLGARVPFPVLCEPEEPQYRGFGSVTPTSGRSGRLTARTGVTRRAVAIRRKKTHAFRRTIGAESDGVRHNTFSEKHLRLTKPFPPALCCELCRHLRRTTMMAQHPENWAGHSSQPSQTRRSPLQRVEDDEVAPGRLVRLVPLTGWGQIREWKWV